VKRPGFFQGIAAAAGLGILGSAFVAVMATFVGIGLVTRLVIALLALVYILYLFSRNAERTGRITTLMLWSAMTLVTWWLPLPLPLYLLIHAGAIWLVRSLYFYSGVIPSLLDMALTGLSLVASIWALSRTGSVFLGAWCFFLVQALFTAIHRSMGGPVTEESMPGNHNFERARRQADAALKQLITR
jgi:hypothetical protein